MRCPECKSKTKVLDNVNTPEGEVYRKRKCDACNNIFFTIEFETDETESFKKEWNRFNRASTCNRKPKKQKTT